MPLAIPAHIAMTAVSLVTLARRGQFRVVCRAKRDALRGLPRALRKRGAVLGLRNQRAMPLLKAMSVVATRR